MVLRTRLVQILQGSLGRALVCHVKQQVKLVGLDKVLKPSVSSLQIPIVMELSDKNELDLKPLVWALAMGSCLGGEAHMQNLLQHHVGSCTTLAAETELISYCQILSPSSVQTPAVVARHQKIRRSV